ncbi:hypothetical protein [Stappia sp.]|uniref:hypothetical protein n=1 Tax=Stappia sp. TaxID=1870903 RepID=UPI003D0B9756
MRKAYPCDMRAAAPVCATPVCAVLVFAVLVLATLAAGPAGADSGPEPVLSEEACARAAARHADDVTPRGPDGDDVAAAAIEGAVIGGLGGRDRRGTGWSAGGAERGARLGGGLAALDGIDRVDPARWQAAFDRGFAACMAGTPLPSTSRERCRSGGAVTGSGHGGRYGASSRRDCR